MFAAKTTIPLNTPSIRVAVVDDHQLVRTGLIQMIHSLPGFEVVLEAGNGKEFQDKIQRLSPPEIILLDIQMPIMDGYETALWIHTHLPLARVLVVSMIIRETAVIRMLQLGVYGFLSKDATLEDLQHALICISEKKYYVNELAGTRMFHFIAEHPHKNTMSETPEITDREFIFLRRCCSELTYRQIADSMQVSPRTIDTYRDHLFEKLQVKSRVGLVIYALRSGLIQVDDLM